MELAYDEPPHRDWEFKDLAPVDPHYIGKSIGHDNLPFNRFYADSRRAVALVFNLEGRFGQNTDQGTEIRLARIPPGADDVTSDRFQAAVDKHPIRVFRATGSHIHYRGVYLPTSMDKPIGVWRFRKLNESWHNSYVDINTWFARISKQTGVVGHASAYRVDPSPEDESEDESDDRVEAMNVLADY